MNEICEDLVEEQLFLRINPSNEPTTIDVESGPSPDFDPSTPNDEKNTVYWISFLYGMAILAPFNAVLSTLDFFDSETPNYPISFVISFAINGLMVVVVLLCLTYSEMGANKVKINLMFALTAVLLVILPTMVNQSKLRFGELVCFWVTVSLLILLGALTGVSQSAVLSYMSMLPDQKYMAIACFAMGVSALTQNAIRAILLITFSSSDLSGVIMYYGLTSLMLLAASACYFIENQNPFSIKYSKVSREKLDLGFKGRIQKLWQESSEPFQKSFPMLFQLFFSMFVTFIVFPGVTCASSVQFINSYAWYSLATVSWFNLFDTIGRFLGGIPALQFSNKNLKWVQIIGFMRLGQVALSILIMIHSKTVVSLILSNLALFAFSNGYLQSICSCYAPTMVSVQEQEAVGNLMVIMITLGVSLGGLLQIPLAKLQ